jgi:predicted Zn-dependent protease
LDSLTRKGEYQKAIDLAAAIRGQAETPKDRTVISRCSGSCLLQLNKASLAVDAFSEAISLDPADYSSYMGRGQAYLALGKTDQAIADCSEAIRREPSDAALYFLRARVYETMGEKRRAKADLAEAEQLTHSGGKQQQGKPVKGREALQGTARLVQQRLDNSADSFAPALQSAGVDKDVRK